MDGSDMIAMPSQLQPEPLKLASGASEGNLVQVQVLSSALEITRVYVNMA
jgi:hypothetical protein